MIIIDCGSELLLVIYHDLPLCRKEPLSYWRVRIGVAGQVLTSIIWLALTVAVCYYKIFAVECFKEGLSCPGITAGISSTIILFMVTLKNSMTLKDFVERHDKYPIICNESLLFLYHFLRNEPAEIVKDFKKFYNFDADQEIQCSNDPSYHAVFNFCFLILMDIAAIASVSNLIIVPDDTPVQTFLRAVPFVSLVILDIVSEVGILIYHDIPLCDQKDAKIIKHNTKFQIARIIQIFVLLCWIGALVYMVLIVKNLHCQDNCYCYITNPNLNCSSCPINDPSNTAVCPANASYCEIYRTQICNNTNPEVYPGFILTENYDNFEIMNCTFNTRNGAEFCRLTHPSIISCVLLALILLDGIYETIGIFFKSYLLPITLPDYVLFQIYVIRDNIDWLIARLGKHEFGFDFNVPELRETLIPPPGNDVL
jgi:hypothetical protein